MKYIKTYHWSIGFVCLSLAVFVGCGSGGGSSDPAPEETVEYSQKISNIIIGNNLVVFAVEVADDRFELFTVNPKTAARNRISDPFSVNNGLRPVALSPDETKIAYRADRNYDGVDELYSNLIDGSDEVLLTDSIATATTTNQGTTVHYNWQWTEDSSRIIFRSDPDEDGIDEIQSISADGTDLLVLSEDLTVKCVSSECWKMSADGLYLSFLVESIDQFSNISQNIYAVSVDQEGVYKLNQTLEDDSRIHDWQWSPDGSRLAYISQNIGEVNQLYTVLANATERVLLNPDSLITGVENFSWSPDSTRLAFTDDVDQAGVVSLYNDLADASDRVHLIDVQDVDNPIVVDFVWSPNGNQIGYRADQSVAGKVELFTVETDGDWHRKMNGALLENTSIQDVWLWSPDSLYISFYAEQETPIVLDELYVSVADTDGGNSQQVNLSLESNTKLLMSSQSWLSDSSRLIYQISLDGNTAKAIYSVLPDGSNTIRLTAELATTETISDWFLASPDNNYLLYQITDSNSGVVGLQSVGVTTASRVNLSFTGIASQAQWLQDSSRAVYVLEASADVSQELYSVLADGTGKLQLY